MDGRELDVRKGSGGQRKEPQKSRVQKHLGFFWYEIQGVTSRASCEGGREDKIIGTERQGRGGRPLTKGKEDTVGEEGKTNKKTQKTKNNPKHIHIYQKG